MRNLKRLALGILAPAIWSSANAQDVPNTSAPPALANAQSQSGISGASAPSSVSAQTNVDSPVAGGGDIIVTAQRRAQRLNDVPISIQATSGAAIAQAHLTDTQSLEQLSPALNFAGSFAPSATTAVMRGSASPGSGGGLQPSVNLVIDGVPTVRQSEFVSDLAEIERIEILAGPQGTLFGKNATAGVINIVTVRPNLERLSVTADLTGTEDGEEIVKGAVNAPLNDKIALRINGFYHHIAPQIKNLAGPDLHMLESYGGKGRLLVDLSSRTNIVFTGSYSRSYDTFGNPFVIVPDQGALGVLQARIIPTGYGDTVVSQDKLTFAFYRLYTGIVELNSDLSDRLKLVSITGYRDYADNADIDTDATGTGVDPGVGFTANPLNYPIADVTHLDSNGVPDHQRNTEAYVSQEVRLAYSAPGLDVILGGFYQNYIDHRSSRSDLVQDGSRLGKTRGTLYISNDNVQTRLHDVTAAVFADVTYGITSTINLFGGLRYTNEVLHFDYARQTYLNPVAGFFDPLTTTNSAPPTSARSFLAERNTNNLSGRAGVQWKPQRDLNFYASYNRGYKGAAANQGRTNTNTSATALLNPELAEAYEIGAKAQLFNRALSFQIAIFTQNIQNIQQTVTTSGPTGQFSDLINAGTLKDKGFEANVTARPTARLTLSEGLAYNDAKYGGNSFVACGPSDVRGVGKCGANGLQDLNGQVAQDAPKWKTVTTAAYERPISDSLKLDLRASYNWRSSVQFSQTHDILTIQHGYGLLDTSVGFGAINDRWDVTLFVKNLTNRFHYSSIPTSPTLIGQAYGFLPRDYKRYGGINLVFNY